MTVIIILIVCIFVGSAIVKGIREGIRLNRLPEAFRVYPLHWATLFSSNVYVGLMGNPYRLINLIDEYVELKKVWNSSWNRYDILAVTESGMPVCWLKDKDAEILLPILDYMTDVWVKKVNTDRKGEDMSVLLQFCFGEKPIEGKNTELPENYDEVYFKTDEYSFYDDELAGKAYDGTFWEDQAHENRELDREIRWIIDGPPPKDFEDFIR